MNLVDLANSRLGPPLGILLSRVLPRRTAYRLADSMAAATARRAELPLVQAVRANQAVLRDLPYEHPDLGLAGGEVLRHAARGYVDLFRAMAGGPKALLESCEADDSLVTLLDRGLAGGRGVIAVSAHMSCFDMFLLSLAARGYQAQALSFADPRGSYRVQNTLRRQYGLNLTPISPQALRSAMRWLREGGLVVTGVDRPAPEGEELVLFGRRSRLPIGHARLSIHTGAPILVGVVQSAGDHRYRVLGKALIDPKEGALGRGDAALLAQRALAVLEDCIRERPEEWLMFFPVWPEILPGGAS